MEEVEINARGMRFNGLDLAADPIALRDTIVRMNAVMNQLIDDEVGVDDGSFLPTGTTHPWEVERWDA